MSKEINLLLAGSGPWAEKYRNTLKNLGININAEPVGREYQRLLNDNVTGVIVATSSDSHFSVARESILCCKHVLVEKPLTETLAEAQELLSIHDRSAVVGMVGHIQEQSLAFQRMQEVLGRVGRIFEMRFVGDQGTPRKSPVWTDWIPHPSYMFARLASSAPKAVMALSKTPYDVRVDYDFGPIKAVANINLLAANKARSLQVRGAAGELAFRWGGVRESLSFTNLDREEQDLTPVDSQPALTRQVLNFVHCIETGDKPLTPLSQGVAVMRILDAVGRSLATGKTVLIK